MYFYKISNLLKGTTCDYKGLNLDLIIPGTQLYPDLNQNNICILASSENIPSKDDLIQLSEDGYNSIKKQIQASLISPVTLENIRATKIQEIQKKCIELSTGTFKSKAYDGETEEEYSCSEKDQMRINGEFSIALAVKAGFSTRPVSWYKNKDAVECIEWNADNMIKLGEDLHKFETDLTDRVEALAAYVMSLTTVEEVQKVAWDTVIPTTTT
ncbi:hypothetical protein [Clostridium sp. JS66]|uniref:hypothetical protein n=1 Tax=Clostridium sp. JS66 TaxID=3064705 RepID=UPI00298E558D|nr:hypothetical protein [Clostridium sp. JS66]WPC40611.1 hypothetical protein Q6H37_22340 [Clostridium sp. JS66]